MNNSQTGASLTELMIAIAVLALIGIGTATILTDLNNFGNRTTDIDNAESARFLLQRNIDCAATTTPGGSLAAACNGTTPNASGLCENLPGIDVHVRAGNRTRVLVPTAGQKIGHLELRACCPAGKLQLEIRQLKRDRSGPATDRLNKNKILDWRPLFAAPTICPRTGPALAKERRVVTGRTRAEHPSAFCPGYFSNVPSLRGPESQLRHFDGIATCPNGFRLIGGGGNCESAGLVGLFTGRSYLIDSHPHLPSSSDGTPEKARSWFASCCGSPTNSRSLGVNVHAICEKI